MSRLICPSREELHRLRKPLEVGERQVLEFFDRLLPEDWEIYVQPHLNGLRPDFVLLHPHAGIAVFEVKDWDLDAMPYYVRQQGGLVSLWCRDAGGKDFPRKDEPIEKVVRYKREILDLYCPRLGIRAGEAPQIKSTVTAGVIVPTATTERIRTLLRPIREHLCLLGSSEPYHPLAGGDALHAGDISAVFPWGRHSTSRWMTPELADDLRAWLVEPDHAAAQREPLPLNGEQRKIATTRTATGYRRTRGPAGCGKSLALAARAAQLSAEGKDVLVVSFNITLLHYLKDLAVRYPHPRDSITSRVTWLHFHDWCKRVCQEASMEEEYRSLFRDRGQTSAEGEDEQPDDIFESLMPELVGRAIEAEGALVTRFDAVLVDEGQDFNLTWWNLLRKVHHHGGEMLLAADVTQDLYNRSAKWTDESMRGAGFAGDWGRLEGCYRFPRLLISHLRRFVEEQLPSSDINVPAEVEGDLFEQPLGLRWLQVAEEESVEACVQAICDITSAASPAVPWADITLLVGTHELGLRCVQALEAPPRGIKVNHVFGGDHASRKRRKMGFWMGDARLKAATVHSFKGWESRTMVVHIGRARTPAERSAAYVSLSRLRRSEKGSFLTVVCSAPQLEAYGRTWPVFENRLMVGQSR